jgi:hypothetical protein
MLARLTKGTLLLLRLGMRARHLCSACGCSEGEIRPSVHRHYWPVDWAIVDGAAIILVVDGAGGVFGRRRHGARAEDGAVRNNRSIWCRLLSNGRSGLKSGKGTSLSLCWCTSAYEGGW